MSVPVHACKYFMYNITTVSSIPHRQYHFIDGRREESSWLEWLMEQIPTTTTLYMYYMYRYVHASTHDARVSVCVRMQWLRRSCLKNNSVVCALIGSISEYIYVNTIFCCCVLINAAMYVWFAEMLQYCCGCPAARFLHIHCCPRRICIGIVCWHRELAKLHN